MKEVIVFNPPVQWVKERILDAGNLIGSVHFIKRTDNTLRKMSYRLHVQQPSIAKKPYALRDDIKKMKLPIDQLQGQVKKDFSTIGVHGEVDGVKTIWFDRMRTKVIDEVNNQMRVLDANKVIKDSNGKVIGRGAWRTIPLDRVIRIVNKGICYNIHQDSSSSVTADDRYGSSIPRLTIEQLMDKWGKYFGGTVYFGFDTSTPTATITGVKATTKDFLTKQLDNLNEHLDKFISDEHIEKMKVALEQVKSRGFTLGRVIGAAFAEAVKKDMLSKK